MRQEKLYDLMTMGFKYQVMMCPDAADIIGVTLTHLENVMSIVSNDEVRANVQKTVNRVREVYCS